MSSLTIAVRWERLPDCCKGCRFHESDAKDEYSPNYHFCTKGVAIPVKKKSCRVKEKYANRVKDGE